MSFSLLPRKLSRALVGTSVLLVTTASALPATAQPPSAPASIANAASEYRPARNVHFKDPGAILGAINSHEFEPEDLVSDDAKGARFIYSYVSEGGKGQAGSALAQSQKAKILKAGMVWGGLHVAKPQESSGAAQADHFIKNGGGWVPDGKTMPGILSFQSLENEKKSCGGLTQEQMRTWVTAFQDRYKQTTGRFPVIETYALWWNKCVGNLPSASRSPLMISNYTITELTAKLPVGAWKAYDIRGYSIEDLFTGYSNVWGGDRAQFMDFVNNANYKPLGVRPAPPVSSMPVVARAPFESFDVAVVDRKSGALYRYVNGASFLEKRQMVFPKGWNSVVSVHVSDVNRDGVRDLISQWGSGNLAVSYGRQDGTFAPAQVIGRGWAPLDTTVGQYAVGENFDSILAADAKGDLRRYSLQGGKLAYKGVIGKGWKGLRPRLVQTDGVGAQEVVAQYADKTLRIYHRYNNGKFVPRPAVIAARNWDARQQAAASPGDNVWLFKDRANNVRWSRFIGDQLVSKGIPGARVWKDLAIQGSRTY